MYRFRMIKEAKKEKGTDDFLGNVVLKLQVVISSFQNCIAVIVLSTAFVV